MILDPPACLLSLLLLNNFVPILVKVWPQKLFGQVPYIQVFIHPSKSTYLWCELAKIKSTKQVITKTLANPYLSPFRITQYSHDPTKPVAGKLYRTEEWVLHGPQLVSVDFGSLDYSSDEFVEIAMTIAYTGYICTVYNFGGEGEKEYKSFYETREAEAEPEPVAAAKKKKSRTAPTTQICRPRWPDNFINLLTRK